MNKPTDHIMDPEIKELYDKFYWGYDFDVYTLGLKLINKTSDRLAVLQVISAALPKLIEVLNHYDPKIKGGLEKLYGHKASFFEEEKIRIDNEIRKMEATTK